MKPLQHRNLFNGDCTFLFRANRWYPDETRRFHAGVLHDFIETLAQSGVDTYLCNPNAQLPWYPSRALPHVLSGFKRGDREFVRHQFPPANETDFLPEALEKRLDDMTAFLGRYLDLWEDGVDWVAEIARACRNNGITPWITLRMNDAHGANSWDKSFMNCALQREAKYRLSGRAINARDDNVRNQQLLNYQHPEVRDYYFTLLRELVEEYDFEGLELDWTRIPACCEPEASPETRATMVEWIAGIRRLTDSRAQTIGKPFPLGLRVTPRLDQLQTIGLDVRQMVREKLIDFVCPSNVWQATWDVPLDQMQQELGENVAIYGVVEDAPNWLTAFSPQQDKSSYRLLSSSPQLLRGNAVSKLALGAHGIETFNFFCTDEAHHNRTEGAQRAEYEALHGLHDLEKLRGTSKHYTFASQTGFFSNPLFEYAEQLPLVLESQWRRALRLPMCAEPENISRLTIQVVVKKAEQQPVPGVSFNGSWPNFEAAPTDELIVPTGIYTHHTAEHTAFNFSFEAGRIKDGWNEIIVYNDTRFTAVPSPNPQSAMHIVSVELAVA